MKKTGICPKCDSSEVYVNTKVALGNRSTINISTWVGAVIETYICLDCGFLEDYLRSSDLLNEKTIEKIRSTWQKI